jgi:hypothetical protein
VRVGGSGANLIPWNSPGSQIQKKRPAFAPLSRLGAAGEGRRLSNDNPYLAAARAGGSSFRDCAFIREDSCNSWIDLARRLRLILEHKAIRDQEVDQ